MEGVEQYISPEQINEELVTLSMLPESRWRNLINLDLIKVHINLNVIVTFCLFKDLYSQHCFV